MEVGSEARKRKGRVSESPQPPKAKRVNTGDLDAESIVSDDYGSDFEPDEIESLQEAKAKEEQKVKEEGYTLVRQKQRKELEDKAEERAEKARHQFFLTEVHKLAKTMAQGRERAKKESYKFKIHVKAETIKELEKEYGFS